MPGKPLLLESRTDFRGGLNTIVNPDLLNANELVNATNARLSAEHASIMKRTGTQRIHPTTLESGATVRGVFQWDSPGGKEVVAIAGGKLHHKTSALGDFTTVASPATFSTTLPTYFSQFRSTSASAAIVLYMASGGNVYSWDGTTLTEIDGTNTIPTAQLLQPYHTRMFYGNITTLPKHLVWTKVGDATDADTGGATDGGTAIIDVLSGEGINGMQLIGSSLAISTEDSIVRFTGYSNEDINISQDTQGISAETGPVGGLAFIRAESIGFILSDRGPYLVQESGIEPIGVKVEPEFDAADRSVITSSVLGYHRGRREIWFGVAGSGDSGVNKTVYIYSLRLQSWTGPFTYSDAITSLTRYEDASGDEWLIAGGDDGFVRHMDIGVKDDVLSDSSGGDTVTMTVELAPLFFEPGPGIIKSLDTMMIQADLPTNSALVIQHAFDGDSFTAETALTGKNNSIAEPYRQDLANQGNRLRLRFVDAGTDIPIIKGFQLTAFNMQRFRV